MKPIQIILLILLATTPDTFAQEFYRQQLNENRALVGDVLDYQVSPDGSTVVYRADQDADNVSELYSVPIGGGAVTKLNGALVIYGDVQSVHIIPNGSTMVSRADQDTDQVFELYSVPIGGRASTGRSIFHSRAATHAACILDISRRHLM